MVPWSRMWPMLRQIDATIEPLRAHRKNNHLEPVTQRSMSLWHPSATVTFVTNLGVWSQVQYAHNASFHRGIFPNWIASGFIAEFSCWPNWIAPDKVGGGCNRAGGGGQVNIYRGPGLQLQSPLKLPSLRSIQTVGNSNIHLHTQKEKQYKNETKSQFLKDGQTGRDSNFKAA